MRISIKVPLKVVLESLRSSQQGIDKLWISIDQDPPRFVLTFETAGIVRNRRLVYEEVDPLKALYSRDTPCVLTCEPTVLAPIATISGVDEITFDVSESSVAVRSHLSAQADATRLLQTAVSLDRSNFRLFHAPGPLELTFALKDFKALFTFLASFGQAIDIFMDAPSRPVLFSARDDALLVDFVLATLANEEEEDTSSSHPT
eukprot:gnl/Trimastix_PCT/3044.p1 GENE.gnl/Trimastix_PCT/3044~~gnl/Trimastix_PCT/3044.p1  ORF type:complete len:203 (+),score=58.73 gnl/Trimastix_PCT/3044:257-865(+)